MTKFNRILIIGNSGAGKTWLGCSLAERLQISLFHMDHIRWDQRGYEIRRSALEIEKELELIIKQDKWILEGVFGKMAERCLPFTTLLIWLDFPWEECKKNLLFRGPQFEGHLNAQEEEKALTKLMDWASTHGSRNDANSWIFFKELYTQYRSDKALLHSREEVTAFLREFSS